MAIEHDGDREGRDADQTDDAIDPDDVIDLEDYKERDVADLTIARLARADNLYHRGGSLVRVVLDEPNPKVLLASEPMPRIVPLTRANLRETISEHACFSRGKRVDIGIPEWVTRAIHDRGGDWPGIRRLRGVVDMPVLRADGSVVDRDGYDERTELLVTMGHDYDVPTAVTREDAIEARDELLEVVCEFPFVKEEHRAAWLAAALTPIARHAFNGPSPLVALDKNTRGAGATLLADAIGIIATGRPMPRMVAARDADEERKRITSIAMAGDSIVLIDNVQGTLGTEALDAALTGTTWRDRILGRSEMTAELPLVVTWFATGNNLEFGADTLRRVSHVRIEPKEERPEERTGWKHFPLLDWVREERPRLVSAALTMLRAYCLAGRPDVGLMPWGSYETWSALVRGAVVWSGMPDPAKTRQDLTSTADGEANALRDLLSAWHELYGARGSTAVAMLRQLADTTESRPGRQSQSLKGEGAALHQLRYALAELCGGKPDTLPSARTVGNRLKKARGRVIGRLAIGVRGERGASGVTYVAREVSDSSDSSDSVSPPTHEREIIKEGKQSHQSHQSHSPKKLKLRSEVRRAHR